MTTEQLQALAGLMGASHAEIVVRCGRCGHESLAMSFAEVVLLAAEEKREGVERLGQSAMQGLLTHACAPRGGAAS